MVGRDDPLPPCCAPESEADLKARVCRFVEEARVDLVLRGLEAEETARRTGVPVWIVRTAFAQVAVEREFLRVSEEQGTVVLRRS